MSTLHIYKSSAGSGKTYTLTLNYLALLLKGVRSYRKILAVTFTNKAAAEMKSRILNSLYLLFSKREKDEVLIKKLTELTGLSDEQIHKRSGEILFQILNDFSLFRVETIDKFFQWIIRSFARETGLQAGYNLELNINRILSGALDLLMYSLDEDEYLKRWLVQFAEEKIAEGKDWNFNRELVLLGEEIFKEKYQDIAGGLKKAEDQKEKIPEYLKKLNSEIAGFENYMSLIGKKALDYIFASKLEINDFSHKESGVAGYFKKLAAKQDFDPKIRARNVLNGMENWSPAKSPVKNEIEKLAEAHLNELLNNAINYFDKYSVSYFTARTITKNIYSFGVLTDIYLKVREVITEKNMFLLSDANLFLKRIIGNNDAPFIFEKAGNYFHHFMLDEFQDTSNYQWHNFRPLILNGLANDDDSLLVGDVKQSIYRWRNSNWEILASQAENSFPGFYLKVIPLDVNWRSAETIVRFNNFIFSLIGKGLSKKIEEECGEINSTNNILLQWKGIVNRIYGDPVQKVSQAKKTGGGYVELNFYKEDKDKYMAMLADVLPRLILDIQARGYKPGDIAILVRKGTQGRSVASVLMQYATISGEAHRFNIISNDSLYIENNPGVRFLVALLKYLRNPEDILNIAFIRNEYIKYLSPEDYVYDIHSVFKDCKEGLASVNIDEFSEFLNAVDRIRRLPLFELIEELIYIFKLGQNPGNIAFIQAFQDIVLNFVIEETSDISAFMEWWDKNGDNQTLNVSEGQDAIQIITIHKAKGLEFPVVILPFCDWHMDTEFPGANYLWCENKNELFNDLEYVPVKYQKELLNTYYREDYINERFHNYIDNINLLYVALTRSMNELFIFANRSEKNTVSEFIYNIISESEGIINTEKEFNWLNLNLSKDNGEEKVVAGEKRPAGTPALKILPDFPEEYPLNRNRSKLVLNTGQAWRELSESDYKQKIGYGTVMHEVFSYINSIHDVSPAVNKILRTGKVSEMESVELKELLNFRLQKENVKNWFDGTWNCMKEREICISKNQIFRPDRVMQKDNMIVVIDYKFGQEIAESHVRQVRSYMNGIKKMGYGEVKGYLWYFTPDIIKEVI